MSSLIRRNIVHRIIVFALLQIENAAGCVSCLAEQHNIATNRKMVGVSSGVVSAVFVICFGHLPTTTPEIGKKM